MFKNKELKVVSYGEVLFDVFGNDRKIGGAPLNLALRTRSFGFPVAMISAIGKDEDGKVISDYMQKNGLDISGIIETEDFDTGVVQVFVNDRGSATYEITFPSAWDYITVTEEMKSLVKNSDVFFYGSLVCRNAHSKETLYHLLDDAKDSFKVFDVNLRAPHYQLPVLEELMKKADFIKFNDEEILEISEDLGFKSDDLAENMKFIAEKTSTQGICVTRGKHGSLLLWEGKIYDHIGYPVKVADTVGAGDSYLASLVSKLLSNGDADEALDFASAVGAIVATHHGANPTISDDDISDFIKTYSTIA